MFMFGQVLVVFFLMFGIIAFHYKGKKKRRESNILFSLIGLLVISAFISNAIIQCIPLPTDKVVVTATGEKNSQASSNEVSIRGYLVGGKEYPIESPVAGKWFWQGDVYRWRNENDSRQPRGTTRSITLEVPYGRDRFIQFNAGKGQGIVEVTDYGDSRRYDLFSVGDETFVNAAVANTDTGALYMVKLGRLLIFTIIIVALMTCPCCVVNKFDNEYIKRFIHGRWDRFFYIFLAGLYVLLMQTNSVDGSFWGDELWQLGWYYADEQANASLILNILLKGWFEIMPYGQEYLLLQPQMFVAATIYIAGLIGSEFKNKRLGVLLSSSVAFSLTIVNQCAMELRPYAFLLFASALATYGFLKKQKYLGKEKRGVLILYGFALAICMASHYFGFAVATAFMFFDIFPILFKKATQKGLLEYVIPIAYLPVWCWKNLKSVASTVNNYKFGGTATIQRLFDIFQWLFGYNNILIACFVLGSILILMTTAKKWKEQKPDFMDDYTTFTLVVIPICALLGTYIYSAYLNPSNSLLFDRYFVSVILMMYFVMCIGIDWIIEVVMISTEKENVGKLLSIFVICMLCIFNWSKVSPWSTWTGYGRVQNTNFKAAAEYVMSQDDAYDRSTIFFVDGNKYINRGITYYTTHNEERDDITHRSFRDIPQNIDSFSTVYLSYGYQSNSKLNSMLNEQFELSNDNRTVKVKKYVRKT